MPRVRGPVEKQDSATERTTLVVDAHSEHRDITEAKELIAQSEALLDRAQALLARAGVSLRIRLTRVQ